MTYIPTDLIPEILSRLSEKSTARLRCVSKLWRSIILSRLRLLFVLERANGELFFFSSPLPQNPYDKSNSSLVVTAEFHMKFSLDMWPVFGGFTSGLIYSSDMQISEKVWERKLYNINTGQYVALPELKRYRKHNSCLGFDPLDKQFKVLFMAYQSGPDDHRILTLGTGKKKEWRKIECPLTHDPLPDHWICINGVLYNIGEAEDYGYMIVCFDVRSETFKFVDAECFFDPEVTKLINCKGKLGGVDLKYNRAGAIVLYLWILEDVERKKWSKYVYTLPVNDICNVFVVGMTSTGEIVLSERFTSKPFCVFYFSTERNTLQRVEIRGPGQYHEAFENDCRVYAFVDYVVNSTFIT
ncbi:hypothetical protein N665_0072s0055 [Sinapis alba]|nr:hypothetical protein N665_0072s0055 [Sinapis alba]